MPEGPETRRAADRVARVVEGRVAERVFFGQAHLEGEGPRLEGRRVEAVRTHGKALLIHFEGDAIVFTHSLLYGRWRVTRRRTPPRTRRQLRFAVETRTHAARLFSASRIEVLHPGDLATHPFLSTLGPDPLHGEGDVDAVLASIEARPRRRLGSSLLDQRCVAGLGNYLRSEILFTAGLHPDLRPIDCDGDALRSLAHVCVELTRQAYVEGGCTFDPERARALRAQGAPRWRWRHAVFGRAGKPCPRCGSTIERIEITGRRVYLCPRCQPAEGSTAPAADEPPPSPALRRSPTGRFSPKARRPAATLPPWQTPSRS